MGDRSVTWAGRRGGARRLAAAGLGTLLLAGVGTAPASADETTTPPATPEVVPNADFRDGPAGWSGNRKASRRVIVAGEARALEVKNASRRSATVLVRSATSEATFQAGTVVRVSAKVRSSRSSGRVGLRAYERSGSAAIQSRTSALVKPSSSRYRVVTASVTLRQSTSRLSVMFFHKGTKARQAMRVREVEAVVVPPFVPAEPDVPTPTPTPTYTPSPTPEPSPSASPSIPMPTVPTPTPTVPSPTPTLTPTAPSTSSCQDLNDPARRNLVFADEFDGSALDTSKWNVRDRTSLSFDAAYITRDAIRVGGGMLTIAGRRLAAPKIVNGGMAERWWSTGYLDTIGKFSRQHGRWEMRAKLPTDDERTRGVWPAFWLRGDKTAGEIDIMESYGAPDSQPKYNASRSYQATLWEDTNLGKAEGKGHWSAWAHQDWQTHSPAVHEDFHVYGLNWTADCLQFTFDEEVVATVRTADLPWTRTAFASPFNIRLNMQVGSSYWGMPTEAETKPAFDYVIDYVRAYAPR